MLTLPCDQIDMSTMCCCCFHNKTPQHKQQRTVGRSALQPIASAVAAPAGTAPFGCELLGLHTAAEGDRVQPTCFLPWHWRQGRVLGGQGGLALTREPTNNTSLLSALCLFVYLTDLLLPRNKAECKPNLSCLHEERDRDSINLTPTASRIGGMSTKPLHSATVTTRLLNRLHTVASNQPNCDMCDNAGRQKLP